MRGKDLRLTGWVDGWDISGETEVEKQIGPRRQTMSREDGDGSSGPDKDNFRDAFSFLDDSVANEEAKQEQRQTRAVSQVQMRPSAPSMPRKKPRTSKNASGRLRQTDTSTGRSRQTNMSHRQRYNSVLVSSRQKGNPLLKFITNVPWCYDSTIVPDYVMGEGACGLFISLRYYLLHPNYLYQRVKQLKNMYNLRVIFCLVDLKDNERALLEITKISVFHDCALILGWSPKEIARYIETYKAYEKKAATAIQEKTSSEYIDVLTECLKQIRSVRLPRTFRPSRAVVTRRRRSLR